MSLLFKKGIHVSIWGLIAAFIWTSSCQPSEETLDPDYSGGLRFSTDTVLFDTVFSSQGSITKRFKVYNPSENAIDIQSIRLGRGSGSPYTLIFNGREAPEIDDFRMLGNDSVVVLVKVTIDPMDKDLPFLVKDSIEFQTYQQHQNVKLISWGQDANFIGDSILSCSATWTNERPYVLFNSVLVDSLCTLTIKKGARIFASPGVFIYVKGTLQALGSASERIVFRNERLDARYQDVPGQWGGIILLEGSKANRLSYTTIRNAQTGLRVGTPDEDTIADVRLNNTIIENMSQSGILAFTSDIEAENTLINNCREFVVANLAGGNYLYRHCTFANFSFDFSRDNPAMVISDNIVLQNDQSIIEDVSFELYNSILYGSLEDELSLNNDGNARLEIFIAGSLLKTTITELDINANILNEDPKFANPFNFDYHLDTLSPAIDNGLDSEIAIDLDSTKRDETNDVGAYEFVTN